MNFFLKGALKSGPAGFMIGVGLGVVGVAVSPMLGLTDGLNSVAQTIFIQSAEGSLRLPLRPPRALICLTQSTGTPGPYPMMGGGLMLTSLDLHAAQAQAALLHMTKNMGQSDLFVAFLSLVSSQSCSACTLFPLHSISFSFS